VVVNGARKMLILGYKTRNYSKMKTNPSDSVAGSLNKREFFAAISLQGMMADPNLTIEESVALAVEAADLLIIELNKEITLK